MNRPLRAVVALLMTFVVCCLLAVPAFAVEPKEGQSPAGSEAASMTAFLPTAQNTATAVKAASNKTIVWVGDSRTSHLREAKSGIFVYDLQDSDKYGVWDFKWGAKYHDMTDNLVPWLEQSGNIHWNTGIVIWMGYNDVVGKRTATNDEYIAYFNQKIVQWSLAGAKVYIVNVGPSGNAKNATKADKEKYKANNKKIEAFNRELSRRILWPGRVIDLYGYLGQDYNTKDGTHYTKATSKKIYNYLKKQVS